MDSLSHVVPVEPKLLGLIPILVLALLYVVPLLSDRYELRKYPGPLAAKLSRAWFANLVLKGNGISSVHKLHEKYGRPSHTLS